MTKLPPGEGTLGAEGPVEGQEQRAETPALSLEDLKKQRADLEARFEEIKRQKTSSIKKQLGDREAMVDEDKRLVSMLEEAQKTLTFFEAQEQQGLLTDPKDKADLTSLRELVTSLTQQREESLQKYDAIMSVPDVKDEVLKDAYAEHEDRELTEEVKKLEADQEKKVSDVFYRMTDYVSKKINFNERKEKAEQMLSQARGALREFVIEANRILKPGDTMNVLNTFEEPRFLERLVAQRKRLGLFAGKEKAAIDYIIVKNREIALRAEKSLDDMQTAQIEIDGLRQEADSIEEAYIALTVEAIKKEGELKGKFPDKNINLWAVLPSRMRGRIEKFANIKRYDGLEKRMVGKYAQWHDAYQEPQNAVMYHLWERLNNKASEIRQGDLKK